MKKPATTSFFMAVLAFLTLIVPLVPLFVHENVASSHYLMQSVRQQQRVCPQVCLAGVSKQSKLPSCFWIVRINSFFEYLQVFLIPIFLALFSISESLI